MPLHNIIDKRSNRYNVNVMCIFEDAWHDNCKYDKKLPEEDQLMYLGIANTTIASALGFVAQEYPQALVTMYLCDVDPNTNNAIDYKTIMEDPVTPRKFIGIK